MNDVKQTEKWDETQGHPVLARDFGLESQDHGSHGHSVP
jgi:hypothetical protein